MHCHTWLLLLFLFVLIFETGFHCTPGWVLTCYIAQVGLKLQSFCLSLPNARFSPSSPKFLKPQNCTVLHVLDEGRAWPEHFSHAGCGVFLPPSLN